MKLRVIIALMSAALLTLVFSLVSVAGPTCTTDLDGDGVCDSDGSDNCVGPAGPSTVNPAQRDDDEDGYGNICDWDVNQDCIVGGGDVSQVFGNLFASAVWVPKNLGAYDINEDGIVGGGDVSLTFGHLFAAPGPSTRACALCTAPAGGGVCP